MHIRVERPDGTYTDTIAPVRSLRAAVDWFSKDDPSGELAPYDWRGFVVFVRGARPAEEVRIQIHPSRRIA